MIAPDLLQLLTGSLRGMFGDHVDPVVALDGLGWAEVRAVHGADADALLFREQGRALVASALLDHVVLAELDPTLTSTARAVVHPWDPDDPAGSGLLLGDVPQTEFVVAPARHGTLVARAELHDVRRLEGFGADTGWQQVGNVSVPEPDSTIDPGCTRAVAAARRAVAAELIGVCEAALALTVAHTTNRHQYGRPIGSFQAVRHRLAEAHVAVSSAEDVLDIAVAAASSADGGAWEARLAKITSGRAQAEVMRSVIQFFGALGVTRESAVHRYVHRGATLDAVYGGHRRLTEILGRELLDGAALAPVVTI